VSYLAKESDWAKLADYIGRFHMGAYTGPIGLDSEFEGVDFSSGDSCVNKADITVWSIGILTSELHPRGYNKAKGCVLPREALNYAPLRRLLESDRIKVAHNSNVDVHAFYNAGVDVQGIVNTLSLARWMLPGRLTYNLDDLGLDLLGHGKTESFNDIFRYPNMVTLERKTVTKHCACGVEGCRLRKDRFGPDGELVSHQKFQVESVEQYEKQQGWNKISQYEIIEKGPSHPLWDRYIAYAQRDAVVAVELYDYLLRMNKQTETPWYK